jgi:O-antigen/teichoic acid export membrane protein
MSDSRPPEVPAAPSQAPATRRAPDSGRFRRGVVSVGGGSAIGVVALFVETIIVARALPISDMGVYVFFQATLALLVIMVDLGFRTTSAQFLASEEDPRRRDALVNSLLTLRLLVLAAAGVLVMLAGPWLARLLDMPALAGLMRYMPLVLALASLDELGTGMLQGFHRYRRIAAAQVARSTLRLGLSALVLLVLGWGLNALVISWIVSLAVSAGIQLLSAPVKHRLRVDWPLSRHALRFGMPLQATRYLWFGMERIHTFLLTVMTGPIGVAFYEVAARIPHGLQRLADAYYAVYHPSLSTRLARNDAAGANALIGRSLRLFSFGTLCLSWGAILFGRDLIVLLFREQYAAAAPAFVVILLGFSMGGTVNLMGYALTAAGQPSKSFLVNLARSSVSVAGAFLLIPALGFTGAAYAVLASQLVAVPLAWWHMRQLRLPGYAMHHLRQAVLAVLMFAAFMWLPQLSVGLRVLLLGAFPAVAIAVSAITLDDLYQLAPGRFFTRTRVPVRAASPPGGGDR